MKVLVTGSRHYDDYDRVYEWLLSLGTTIVVHGRARGADYLAHIAAHDIRDVEERAYPADWEAFGMQAGPIRNQQMIDEEHTKEEPIDLCLAFPMDDSIGTWDCVRRAIIAGIPVEVVSDNAKDQSHVAALRSRYATGQQSGTTSSRKAKS